MTRVEEVGGVVKTQEVAVLASSWAWATGAAGGQV